ncbi:MAG: hypothetical protein M3R12_12785 [Actinomycetota bacterium]|nr:hypothetical protein [Actinomycetota bacterium]
MTDENGTQGASGHLLFVWSASGWTLRERDGSPPAKGTTLEEGDVRLQVSKIGPSPFPGDKRLCAYTELA